MRRLAGRSAAAAKEINTLILASVERVEQIRRMGEIGTQTVGDRSADMGSTLKAETEKFAELVRAGKVVLD